MKSLLASIAFAVLASACAHGPDLDMRYPGTAPSIGSGVMTPGQSIVSQPQASPFGTPSNIPDPIRAPAMEQAAFGTPVDMDALYGYDGQGRMGMAEGDPGKAEFNFERALEVNPFDPIALNNLAVAKAEQGQFYEAMSLLERAAKLAPDNSEVVANLARLRGYVQSYATAGIEPVGAPKPFASALPPAPPALWGAVSYLPATGYDAGIAPRPSMASPGEDFVSDACRRVTSRGGKVEIVCEPAR